MLQVNHAIYRAFKAKGDKLGKKAKKSNFGRDA